jgi:hypothetical protein
LHIDAMQLPRFDAPGHWATDDRGHRWRGAGTVYVVSVVDDRSRLAYCELHPVENQHTPPPRPCDGPRPGWPTRRYGAVDLVLGLTAGV